MIFLHFLLTTHFLSSYDIYLSWFNHYYMPSGVSEIKHLRTGYGYPTAPLDPQAFALTPDTILLYWKLPQTLNAPASEIKYKVCFSLILFK